MTDSDFNLVRPSEALHNIADTTPAKYRHGKNKRRNPRQQNNGDELLENNDSADCHGTVTQQDDHSIDYTA